MPQRAPLDTLSLVLGSVDAIRNPQAWYVLLFTFAASGLLTAMAETALAAGASRGWPLYAAAALFIAFYGGNAAGIVLMDDARGAAPRTLGAVVRASLFSAHRLLLVLLIVGAAYALFAGALLALLWLCRASVTGALIGPALFTAVVPVGVVSVGLALLALLMVVVPLAAPGVWAGRPVGDIVGQLARWIRTRLPTVALMTALVSLLTAAVGAVLTFLVMAGGRIVAQLSVAVVGIDVPAQQLMAGLFGYGLRSLGAAGAPVGATAHGAAALIGGGVVFVLALVLPGLVYLRGTCAVYLALQDD